MRQQIKDTITRIDTLKEKALKCEWDFFDNQAHLCANRRDGYIPAMHHIAKGNTGKYVIELLNNYDKLVDELCRLDEIIANSQNDVYYASAGYGICQFCKRENKKECKNLPSRECFLWNKLD